MPTIWRLNIKPETNGNTDPRKFCIDKNILGIGWPVDSNDTIDWNTYYKLAEEKYYNKGDKGWWPAINAIKERVEINDLCWTRDWNGSYYLGRIKSDWRYEPGKDYTSVGIVNVRDCDWKRIGTVDSVPGKVVNSFISGRTIQVVNDASIETCSTFLYNSNSNDFHYQLTKVTTDLLSLISNEDCEDIVGLFLQEKGYRIIPSSCKNNTAAYEFVMKHISTGKSAVAQVKQGEIDLDINLYSSLPCEVFLFTTKGKYEGSPAKNVICIQPDEIRLFIKSHHKILPDKLKHWITISEKLS